LTFSQIYFIIDKNQIDTKAMMRRVDLGCSFSELVIVKDQYETYFEEHPGASNRNPLESRLRRSQTVIYWAVSNIYSVLVELSVKLIWVVPRKINLSSL